jgi:hypothetical protein
VAKVNFRQQKRQKELARKARQTERLARRGERSSDGASAVDAAPAPVPVPDGSST